MREGWKARKAREGGARGDALAAAATLSQEAISAPSLPPAAGREPAVLPCGVYPPASPPPRHGLGLVAWSEVEGLPPPTVCGAP